MLLQIAPYIISIAFTLSFCYYSKYQFKDERNQSVVKGKWHKYGASMRILMVIIMFFRPELEDIFLIGAIQLPMFPVGINIIALNQSPLYVGKTSWWDKNIGMWQWPLYLIILISAIIFKIYGRF